MKTVHFYTRYKCSICKEAKVMLELLQEHFPFQLVEVDIDTDDQLTEKYGIRIPVVTIDGEEVSEGIIDFDEVRKRLQQ
ncbi:glutaredoxin family protein [Bacillus carboniphilus]